MSNLARLQHRLREMDCHGIVVPSTDEFLSEFAQPFAQRLRWVTGFGGSTGLAIITQRAAALFVDGRYKSQGVKDTAGTNIEVLDASGSSRDMWVRAHVPAGEGLAIDTRLQSYADVVQTRRLAAQIGIKTIETPRNPIDELWGAERPLPPSSVIVDYPTHFAGASSNEKCSRLRKSLTLGGTDCELLTDPEDVAWLLNVRTHDSLTPSSNGWPIVPIPLSRALIEASGQVFWFVDHSRIESDLSDRLRGEVQIIDPGRFEPFLRERVAGKVVGANLRRTPHRFAAIVEDVGSIKDDRDVARRRWHKHKNEIERAREGHYLDGQAVIRFMAWLKRTVLERAVTELEAAQKLTELRGELAGYKGPSMPLMSASGASGALPHYIPPDHSDIRVNDHPIYWMDSGGQFYGCSTDNTVCLALKKPERRHVRAHTLVIKGFIAVTRARFPEGIYSTQLDSFARQYLWQEGMDYEHGTGHGVGNFMNIHEGPHIRKEVSHPMVAPMEVGMIVSNEPAYYAEGDFGIRVESHLLTVPSVHKGFLEFEILSRLPIDPLLIDESLLSSAEKKWLADYHLWIESGYSQCFDQETSRWLRDIVTAYTTIADS